MARRSAPAAAQVPRADEAERSIAGCALAGLAGPQVLQQVLEVARPADFFHPATQAVVAAVGELLGQGLPVDVITVAEQMRRTGTVDKLKFHDGEAYLAGLANAAATAEPILHHARLVRRAAIERRRIEVRVQLAQLGAAPAGELETELAQLAQALDELDQDVRRPVVPATLPTVSIGAVPDPGPPRWLVQDLWVCGAFGFCGAEPKSWKSWVTLTLALSVASGRPAFGKFAVEVGPVLVLSVEGGKGLARHRLGLLARAHNVALQDLPLAFLDVETLRLDQPDQAAALIATVDRLRPLLLVLDPLRELHSGDENDSALITTLLGPLRAIQGRTGTAVIVVHHSAKGPVEGWRGRRGGQRLRGSSALHGASDSALYLTAEGTGERKRVTVQAEHRAAVEPEPFTLAMRERGFADGQGLWLEIVEEAPETRADRDAEAQVGQREKVRAAILRVVRLAAMPGRAALSSKRAVATAAKARVSVVGALLDELIDEGRVVVGRRGALSVVEAEEPPAEADPHR